jgi:hypothetical protein
MKDKNTPAFPFVAEDDTGMMINMGISQRDYFAAKAMQGMLSACTGWSDANQDRLASTSYRMADEMLKARGE